MGTGRIPSRDAMKSRLLKVGVIGSVVAAIFCFTPLLVWSFTALGASGALAYLDSVLLPLLGVLLALTLFAFWQSRRKQ